MRIIWFKLFLALTLGLTATGVAAAADLGEVTFTNAAGQAVIRARVVKVDTNGIVYSASGTYGKATLAELNDEDRARLGAIVDQREKARLDAANLQKEMEKPMLLIEGKVLPREEFEIEIYGLEKTGLIGFRTHNKPTKKTLLRQPIFEETDLIFFRVTSSRVHDYTIGQRITIVAADIGTYNYERTAGKFVTVRAFAEGDLYKRTVSPRAPGK